MTSALAPEAEELLCAVFVTLMKGKLALQLKDTSENRRCQGCCLPGRLGCSYSYQWQLSQVYTNCQLSWQCPRELKRLFTDMNYSVKYRKVPRVLCSHVPSAGMHFGWQWLLSWGLAAAAVLLFPICYACARMP